MFVCGAAYPNGIVYDQMGKALCASNWVIDRSIMPFVFECLEAGNYRLAETIVASKLGHREEVIAEEWYKTTLLCI
jgi:hypothetical protein